MLTSYLRVHVIGHHAIGTLFMTSQEVMSQLLESRMPVYESPLHRRPATADHLDVLRPPASSVLAAAYRQQTASTPYWTPATSPSGDVIMTSYGVGTAAGYVVHSGGPSTPGGLLSPWAAGPPPSRAGELTGCGGVGGGYGSHGVGVVPAALSMYGGSVDHHTPWTAANNYVPSPPSTAISPPFHALPPPLTRTSGRSRFSSGT